jgi:DNA-binding NarL/FixJ family response regulator
VHGRLRVVELARPGEADVHEKSRDPLKRAPFEPMIGLSTRMVRILIADDHDIVREGIRALIEEHNGWSICGEAVTGREAVLKAMLHKPDLVILDVGMPEMNGLEAARQIHRAVPTAKILVLTVHEVDRLAEDFVEAGASGYLVKADTGRTLVDAVTTLLHGGTYFSGRLQRADDDADAPYKPPRTRLTRREREVLQLLAEGKSNKDIGIALRISTKTAETHRARLMAKLGVHSIAELIRYAIRNQIVEA